MVKRLRLRYRVLIVFCIFFLISNLAVFIFYNNLDFFIVVHDADRKSNGNTLITYATFPEMIEHKSRIETQTRIEPNNQNNKIIEMDPKGNVVWEFARLAIPHEVLELPNSNLLVADTENDRVIQINYPDKDIVWSWEPALINWTQVNSNWELNHYYNSPLNNKGEVTYDWTHINDVDFKNYGSWNACLISLRNFDLIVEINYTADFISPNNPNNIVWWYGEHDNYTMLSHQHNPDYLNNGNIIVADSGNDRIIEVNYTSKKIDWIYQEHLMWPRDADELENGNLLITDSDGGRVIELDRLTNKIVWSFSRGLIIPYEADMLANGNILISNEYHGQVIEVNRNKEIVWMAGLSYIKAFIFLNSISLLGISSLVLYYKYKIIKNFNVLPRKRKIGNSVLLILFSSFIVIGVIFLFFTGPVLAGILRLFYQTFGPGFF